MKILLTVNYLVDIDSSEFWDKATGCPHIEIDASLKKRFPKKIKLFNTVHAHKYSLIHQTIDRPNANLITCPVCKRLLTDKKKPNPIEALDDAAELEGVLMCKSCAWQLEWDVKAYGVEHVMDKFKNL